MQLSRPCPYCAAIATAPTCARCGLDVTTPRRVCAKCQQVTPSSTNKCIRCGAIAGSELGWKVPVIIAMFVLAFVISVALAAAK